MVYCLSEDKIPEMMLEDKTLKKIRWMAVLALAGALLAAEPAMAVQASAVVLGPGVEAQDVVRGPGVGGPGNAPGPAEGGQAAVPGSAGTQNTAGAEVPVHEVSLAPPGDEGVALSPVLTAEEVPSQPQEESPAESSVNPPEETPAVSQEETSSQQVSGRTVDPGRPMVALTFDDGPQASVGNRIMDCLAQYGGKATFFMVGDRVASRKTEVQRMVAEGHEVANHTMNHKYLQKLGAAEIQAQVNRCNDVIEAACGVRPRIMRLPGGNHNGTVLANTGMPMIQWNIDTLDWKTKNADKTVAAVLNHVKDGDIILMHELYSQSGDAALRIIPELHRRGFQMVTVSEMAAARGRTLQSGKLYSSFH